MNTSEDICLGIKEPGLSSTTLKEELLVLSNEELGFYSRTHGLERSRSRISLTPFFLAAITFTIPIQFSDPIREFRRSGSSSLYWISPSRIKRRISLYEIWNQTLRVFEEAQNRRTARREIDERELFWTINEE